MKDRATQECDPSIIAGDGGLFPQLAPPGLQNRAGPSTSQRDQPCKPPSPRSSGP